MSSTSNPYVVALETFYDTVSPTYDKSTRFMHDSGSSGLIEAAGMAIQEGSWVLDLATGTGKVALSAASKVGSTGHILAIDISDGLLQIAAKSAQEQGVEKIIDFVKADVARLALPEKYSKRCFDAVTCGSAIAMFPNLNHVLQVIGTDFLKPGGVFTADMYGPNVPAKAFLDVSVPRGFEAPLDPMWLTDQGTAFRRVFESSAFELKEIIATDQPSGFTWDASTPELVDKLWKSVVEDWTWVSFGMEKMDEIVVADIKKAWIAELETYKGSDGHLATSMKRHLAVAVLKR